MSRAGSVAKVGGPRELATLRGAMVALLVIASCACAVAEDENLGQLKQRAASASGGEQARLCIDVARLELKEADSAYNQGEVDKAQSAVADIVTYSEEATQAASSSGKNLKHIELALRGISSKLSDIRRSVNFEDRPPLEEAVNRIESMRSELLAKMFK
jgi:hypothetical protein